MTLTEKIGQMFIIDIKTTKVDADLRSFLERGKFGNIILFRKNLVDADQTKVLIKQINDIAVTNYGIPMFVAVDQEGGTVDRLSRISNNPLFRHSARRLGKLYEYNPKRARRIIRTIAKEVSEEMHDLGFNINLAPVLDLAKDQDAYIFDRSFSGSPKTVSAVTQLVAKEYRKQNILTTGKHFPNLSQSTVDSHTGLPYLRRSMRQMMAYEFKPFRQARKSVDAIMLGHMLAPAIDKNHPTSISRHAVDILRTKLKFKGLIMTDDIKMHALSKHYSHQEIVLRAVAAGVDMIIMAWEPKKQLDAIRTVKYAVEHGAIDESQIDDSVRRILLRKYKMLIGPRKRGKFNNAAIEDVVVPGY